MASDKKASGPVQRDDMFYAVLKIQLRGRFIRHFLLFSLCCLFVAQTSASAQTRAKIISDASKCTFDCLEGAGNKDRQMLTLASLTQSNEYRLVDYRHFTVLKYAVNSRNKEPLLDARSDSFIGITL